MSTIPPPDRTVRPLIDVIGPPSPETCRRLVVLLKLAEPSTGGARQKIVASADRGQIYVIAFSTGVIKVGQSKDGKRRVAQHRSDSAKHGVSIDHVWVSPLHLNYEGNEGELIAFCRRSGGRVAGGNHQSEYFTGVDFAAVQAFAESLVGIPK
ncbi:hypothetical protein ACQP10_08575 [Streptosporangium sandarakinum]|uniref:hypothetical protein n=1 Tax=Streptosporangium sandarakinum TaxID=1260955 RepID=UPI003D913166